MSEPNLDKDNPVRNQFTSVSELNAEWERRHRFTTTFRQECQEYINTVVEKYCEEIEGITRKGFERVLSQAIKSGDFIRCVDAMGSHTGMMYKPYYKLGIIEGIIKYHAELAECVCDSTIPIGACLKCDLDRVLKECAHATK